MTATRPSSVKTLFATVMFTFAAGIVGSLCFVLNGGMSLNNTASKSGLVYHGMVLGASDSACEAGYELLVLGSQKICTHGPDPAPKDVDVRETREPEGKLFLEQTEGQVMAASVSCTGDGQSGNRIQLVYAYAAGQPNRYSTYAASLQQWAQNMNRGIADSAAKTGGASQVRFAHDANCIPVIDQVQLTSSGDDSFNNTIYEMYAAGYNRTDRKYLIWVDANVYCGISTFVSDDRPTGDNANNVQTSWSRVDNGCWGLSNSVELHELSHMLGAVQTSAPHTDGGGHCTDEYDRLCYNSTGNATLTYPCNASGEALLDCNDDDYFSTSAASGSYLDSHWNMAKSSYLETQFPAANSVAHPDGTLVKAQNTPSIYLVEASTRRYIPSVEVMRSQGYSVAQIKPAVSGDLSLPIGDNLNFREGALLKGSGSNVYIVDTTVSGSLTKRLITSSAVMGSLGYTASDIITVNDSALTMTDGPAVNASNTPHPDGTLVISPNGPDIFWIENGQKRYVALTEIIASQGIVLRSIRLANAADIALPDYGNQYFREGSLVKTPDSPNVYVIDYTDPSTYRKRLIANGNTFASLGYSSAGIYTVNAAALPVSSGPVL